MPKGGSFNYKLFIRKNITGLVAAALGASFLYCSDAVSGEGISFLNIISQSIDKPSEVDLESLENDAVIITELVGEDDIIYQPETDIEQNVPHVKEPLTSDDIQKLKDIDYARSNFYIIDKRTSLTYDDYTPEKFLSTDLTIDNNVDGPKVLIFHTHAASEWFADSDTSNPDDSIVGAGEYLCNVIEERYGIETMHYTGEHDVVDGKIQRLGAYERIEPEIRKILNENPSIQVAIDLHRDGVNENTRLVTEIDGKPTAKIMFFNGLCKLATANGLEPISGLENEYLEQNLAFSFNMQLNANSMFPDLTRKIYLNAYRYSLHMLPKTLLVEAGAQTNTKEEIWNAMDYLAEVLVETILE